MILWLPVTWCNIDLRLKRFIVYIRLPVYLHRSLDLLTSDFLLWCHRLFLRFRIEIQQKIVLARRSYLVNTNFMVSAIGADILFAFDICLTKALMSDWCCIHWSDHILAYWLCFGLSLLCFAFPVRILIQATCHIIFDDWTFFFAIL